MVTPSRTNRTLAEAGTDLEEGLSRVIDARGAQGAALVVVPGGNCPVEKIQGEQELDDDGWCD